MFPQLIKLSKSHTFGLGLKNENNAKYSTSQEDKYKGKNKQATFAAMTSKSVFYAHRLSIVDQFDFVVCSWTSEIRQHSWKLG